MSNKKNLGWLWGEGLVILVGIVVLVAALLIAQLTGRDIISSIVNLNSTMIYVLVGALVFAEAALFLGFIIPCEIVVIFGGVLASGDHVSLPGLIAVVAIAAVVGDTVAFWIGHKYGDRILSLKQLKHHKSDIDHDLKMLEKRGAKAMFIARFVPFMRVVMPGLAGASNVSFSSFISTNAPAGIVWGVVLTLVGWVIGYSYHMASLTDTWSALALLLIIISATAVIFSKIWRTEVSQESNFEAKSKKGDEQLAKELKSVKNKK